MTYNKGRERGVGDESGMQRGERGIGNWDLSTFARNYMNGLTEKFRY